MLNVRLADDHLYGKLLFTWLSLVMFLMVSFYAVPFPRVVLDETWDIIESVSEGFPVYFYSLVCKKAFEPEDGLSPNMHRCITDPSLIAD